MFNLKKKKNDKVVYTKIGPNAIVNEWNSLWHKRILSNINGFKNSLDVVKWMFSK